VKLIYLPNWKSQQRQFEKKDVCIYPVRLAMEATWHRDKGDYIEFDNTKSNVDNYDRVITKLEGIPFSDLPMPDRKLTRAFDAKYQQNGNFKYHPGTYILSAGGCWWGKCKFCVENGQKYEVRGVPSVIKELCQLKEMGFKEVFDDSATFPDGDWLREFCYWKIAAGLKDFPFSCNMRIGADVDFKLMKQAGFRMLLMGVESASQYTLDKINKGVKYEQIIPTIKQAAEAGLSPHITIMVGYPWESDNDTDKTISLARYLLIKGYAKTAQASVYDVEGEESKEGAAKAVRRLYGVWAYPEFWYNKIKNQKTLDDWKYLWRQIKEGINNV